jgi:transcription antitermination factor NusG
VRIDPRGGPRPSSEMLLIDASLAPPRPPNRVVPSQLAEALDLVPLLERVSKYARTRRGAEAIVRLVAPPPAPSPPSFFKGGRRRRKDRYYDYDARWKRPDDDDDDDDEGAPMIVSVASSAEMASSEYELVREATDVLLTSSSTRIGPPTTTSPFEVSLPPTFDLFDGEDRPIDVIDDDEWMGLCLGPPSPPGTTDPYEQQIDLRAILQAEQVVKLLMDTRAWAEKDGTRTHVPGLSNVARMITECDDDDGDERDDGVGDGMQGERTRIGPIADLHRALEGAVEIVRAGPSLSDPDNRRSYAFRLANGKFPELDALREREGRLLKKTIVRRGNYDNGKELAVVRGEISTMEDLVGRKLGLAVARAARRVSRGMDALARLDAIFAKASYGLDWGGEIPDVGMGGRLRVMGFVHPVLALRREGVDGDVGAGAVAPVDLLVPGKGEGHRALVISGPNGGGKTLALKSFGLAAIMAKLAIPIPTARGAGDERRPIVDYFDDVLVEVGDSQNIRRRESTLMARLNSFSTLIQRMANTSSDGNADARLILLDELGGGTDPVAGSALAQSILEKLISVSSDDCSVVATTHSPQLKALSANDCRFESASVLMNDARHPTFRLSYGTTGESFTLEAARRARPSLPDDVIQRAAELMNGDDDGAANSLQRYLTALEQEQRNARELVEETEATYREVLEYKDDMVSKIQVSKMQLSRLESRLGDIFKSLKGIEGDAYELVGDSLGELRLMKRKLQTEEELLSEKGLRRVPESYSFYEGETVVIIADSEFKGYDAVVKEVDVENPLIVRVVPVLDLFSFNEDDAQEPLALRRRDVAIFDYPKWGLSDDKFAGDRKKSRSNLISVLSTLTTSEKKNTSATKVMEDKTPFLSARQRKASAAAEKKSSKAKKRVK